MSERDDWAEINRLEAELAQARAELAAQADVHTQIQMELSNKHDAAFTDLAFWQKESEEQNASRCELLVKIGELRAELAAENARADQAEKCCGEITDALAATKTEYRSTQETLEKTWDRAEAAEARERVATELLKEARWSVEHCRLLKLLARIDAALNKGKTDGQHRAVTTELPIVERLTQTAEGDCREMRRDQVGVDYYDLTKWSDLMDEAAERIKDLVEALRPFADEAEGITINEPDSLYYEGTIKVGMLRAAAAAIARAEGKQDRGEG